MSPPPSAWERWKSSTAYPYLWIALYGLWLLFSSIAAFWLLARFGRVTVRVAMFCLVALLPPLLVWLSDRTAKWYEPGRH